MNAKFNRVVERIRAAKSILLSTHRHADGDGIGAEIGFYHAMKKIGKQVRVLNVDPVPGRYSFLEPELFIQCIEGQHDPLEPTDLALVFDTNDRRLMDPLYEQMETHCREIIFVDHHYLLNLGPMPPVGSLIDTRAASTGEITFNLIKALGVPLDPRIARAIYTSVVFDTQQFRFLRGSSKSYLIAAELLDFEKDPDVVLSALFATRTPEGLSFLGSCLSRVQYSHEGRVAFVRVQSEDFRKVGSDPDEAKRVLDMALEVDSVQLGILMRQEAPEVWKLSLRSRGQIPVLSIAESLGGGGHLYSAGAHLVGDIETLEAAVMQLVEVSLNGTTEDSEARTA